MSTFKLYTYPRSYLSVYLTGKQNNDNNKSAWQVWFFEKKKGEKAVKKNIVVPLLALLLLSIFACDEAVNVRFPNENDGTEKIFRIERTVRDYTNPVLYVACKNIKIDYEKNILTIIGLIGLSGDNGSKFSWISENVKIQNENLIIETDDLKFYIIDVIPSPGTK